MRWSDWLENASASIATFFEQAFRHTPSIAYADTADRPPKPTKSLVLWRREQEELSVCVFADQPYFQYYGTGEPALVCGGVELAQSALPASFAGSNLTWWSIPFSFSGELKLTAQGQVHHISLQG